MTEENNMRNSELKQLINMAYEMAESMYQTPYGQYFAQKGVKPFKDLLMLDLVKYVSYLGNVKGVATEREVVLFKDCYIDPFSSIGISQAQAALDSNLEGNDYGCTIPFLLSAYLLIDIEMYNQGTDKKGMASRFYIDLFKDIGVFFLEFNNDISPKELYAVQHYTAMLEDARNNKLSGVIDEEFLQKEKTDDQPQATEEDAPYSEETHTQTNKEYDRTFAIGSKGEGKKDKLLRSFDVLKNDFKKNDISISETVARMFEIDVETAVDMWTYLLSRYESEAKSEDAWYLTGGIISKGSMVIGDEEMDNIILNNPTLKHTLFYCSGSWLHISVREIIRRRIENEELALADELLQMVYDNPNKRDSWYEIMSNVMPSFKEISSDAYDLLELWCDKVEDTEERAKLILQLTEYVD